MKGYLYTLEVLIAISIIFVSMVMLFRYAPTQPDLGVSILKQQGFEALGYMDDKGTLRELVLMNNETAIEEELNLILLKAVNFETDICSLSCNKTSVPANKTVVAVDYYVSGYKDAYLGKKLRLWLWRS